MPQLLYISSETQQEDTPAGKVGDWTTFLWAGGTYAIAINYAPYSLCKK